MLNYNLEAKHTSARVVFSMTLTLTEPAHNDAPDFRAGRSCVKGGKH